MSNSPFAPRTRPHRASCVPYCIPIIGQKLVISQLYIMAKSCIIMLNHHECCLNGKIWSLNRNLWWFTWQFLMVTSSFLSIHSQFLSHVLWCHLRSIQPSTLYTCSGGNAWRYRISRKEVMYGTSWSRGCAWVARLELPFGNLYHIAIENEPFVVDLPILFKLWWLSIVMCPFTRGHHWGSTAVSRSHWVNLLKREQTTIP